MIPLVRLCLIAFLFITLTGPVNAKKSGVFYDLAKELVGALFENASKSFTSDFLQRSDVDEQMCASLTNKLSVLEPPIRIDRITVTLGVTVDCEKLFVHYVKMIELTRADLLDFAGTSDLNGLRKRIESELVTSQCAGFVGLPRKLAGSWAYIHDYVDNDWQHLFRVNVRINQCPGMS